MSSESGSVSAASAMTRRSPAKINLTLRVGGMRPDGFHDLESLVARIEFCDTVRVSASAAPGYLLTCDRPEIPTDDSNLALRAAFELSGMVGARGGWLIELQKRIPAGAGLGGGSSNAAAVLLILHELWDLKISRAELVRAASRIGSDVPLFLHSPVCLVRGRGEFVLDLPFLLDGWVVLLMPPIHSSTRDVYAAFDRLAGSRRAAPREDLIGRLPEMARTETRGASVHPAPRAAPGEQDALRIDAPDLEPLLCNDLERAACEVSRGLAEFIDKARRLAGRPLHMTGSGATMFSLFGERAEAMDFCHRMRGGLQAPVQIASFSQR